MLPSILIELFAAFRSINFPKMPVFNTDMRCFDDTGPKKNTRNSALPHCNGYFLLRCPLTPGVNAAHYYKTNAALLYKKQKAVSLQFKAKRPY